MGATTVMNTYGQDFTSAHSVIDAISTLKSEHDALLRAVQSDLCSKHISGPKEWADAMTAADEQNLLDKTQALDAFRERVGDSLWTEISAAGEEAKHRTSVRVAEAGETEFGITHRLIMCFLRHLNRQLNLETCLPRDGADGVIRQPAHSRRAVHGRKRLHRLRTGSTGDRLGAALGCGLRKRRGILSDHRARCQSLARELDLAQHEVQFCGGDRSLSDVHRSL
jgi:hypothetical protein